MTRFITQTFRHFIQRAEVLILLCHIEVFCATEGVQPAERAAVEDIARVAPVLLASNMSLGINLLQLLAKKAARILGDGFDVEIVERHHRMKKDAPSGTALMLAESVNEALGGSKENVCGRCGMVGARRQSEIGIHAVRGGTIVGEHEVMFAGEDEIVTLSHSARSRKVFAAGALRAAKWLAGRAPGSYDMDDLLAQYID